MDLKELQEAVNARWGEQEDNPCHGSDKAHALVHMMKAVGKIAAVQNDAEHERRGVQGDEVGKYLADLVICAARFGCGVVDLDEACAARLQEKFPAGSRWGIFDKDQNRWWPRSFATNGDAQAHLDRVSAEQRAYSGSGLRAEVRLMSAQIDATDARM